MPRSRQPVFLQACAVLLVGLFVSLDARVNADEARFSEPQPIGHTGVANTHVLAETAGGTEVRMTVGLPAVRVVSSLAIVIGLLLGGVWLLRYGGGGAAAINAGELVRVLSRIRIGSKSHAYVVQFGDGVLLLGDGPAGLRTLACVNDPDACARFLADASSRSRIAPSARVAERTQTSAAYHAPTESEIRAWMDREQRASSSTGVLNPRKSN